VKGTPQPGQKSGSNKNYVLKIRDAASAQINMPSNSPRISVEVFFCARSIYRPDVDNVLKPILDALKGIAYQDDMQVRSVRAVAIPKDDAIIFSERIDRDILLRLFKGDEFLVSVYEGVRLPSGGL
jgi:hypothetical protein